jgi:hypothetical protein
MNRDDNGNKVFISKSGYRGSMEEYFCEVCNVSFTSRSSWNAHKASPDHLRRAANYEKYTCLICKAEFAFRKEYKDHKAGLAHRRMEEELNDRKRDSYTVSVDRKKLEVSLPDIGNYCLKSYGVVLQLLNLECYKYYAGTVIGYASNYTTKKVFMSKYFLIDHY